MSKPNLLTENFDVITIGAGPGGCTTATLLAQQGLKTLLLDRTKAPTFKIGESLIPGTYWTLRRLGVIEKMKNSHFQKKYSVQFYGQSGKGSAPFYFYENDPHESSITWQVLRSEFDQMLLENAIEHGVQAERGVAVHQILFDGDRAVGVRAKQADGEIADLFAQVVVDATGQSALLSRQMKLGKNEVKLKNASIFTHFEDAVRDEGIDEGATLIMHTENKDSWFWYIPLANNIVSVGVVGAIDYLMRDAQAGVPTRTSAGSQQIFDNQVEKCQTLKSRIKDAKQLFPVKVTKDFSYRAAKIAGHGWVLVGDAFGFLDPVYSSGVLLSLRSGEMAADCIMDAFATRDFSGSQLGLFRQEFIQGMEAFRKLVYAFYTKEFSFAKFLKKFPHCKQGIIDILSGNVFKPDVHQIFEPMKTMCPVPEDFVW